MKNENCKTINTSEGADGTNDEATKVSERKLAANRANAQKSSGPRTQRGKSYSRRNSFKHGLLAQKVLLDGNGQLSDPKLSELYEALFEQYGSEDIRVQLLLDTLIMDYWRMQQALDLEVTKWKEKASSFLAYPWIPQLQRYATANRNSFLKNLDLLSKAKQAGEDDAGAGEDVPPSDLPAAESQSDTPAQAKAAAKLAADIEKPRPSVEETEAVSSTSERADAE